MLALYFACALAMHTHHKAPHANVDAFGNFVQTSTLIPSGTALGTWTPPSTFENGKLMALLEDANGLPMWVLDGEIGPTGKLEGRLLSLEYASNPAYGLPDLAITGHALLRANGDGVFSATIYSVFVGDVPVYPFGKIEGALKQSVLPPTVAFLQAQRAIAAAGAAHAAQSNVTTQATAAELAGGMIVCPKVPGLAITGLSSAGVHAGFGASSTGVGSLTADVQSGMAGGFEQKPLAIECPWERGSTVFAGQSGAGQFSQGGVGTNLPSGVGGVLCARWYTLL